MTISVILCTHNPRPDYFKLVLDGLKGQTLASSEWELIVVDNRSAVVLGKHWDISWQPNGRHVREETAGLTPARLRGIRESQGELLVFVDDDNVLASDYLERSLEIAGEWPVLGAWGGSLIGRFETPPPDWVRPYLQNLAIRRIERDVWSNLLTSMEACPAGAGMVVRLSVAQAYSRVVAEDSRRAQMDRKGNSLMSCGDLDLAYTACDMGLGTGLFKRLSLEHLIPSARLSKDYLLRLVEAQTFSRAILNSFREVPVVGPQSRSRLASVRSLVKRMPLVCSEAERIAHEFFDAAERGRRAAQIELR